jgi:hypothetical protein
MVRFIFRWWIMIRYVGAVIQWVGMVGIDTDSIGTDVS